MLDKLSYCISSDCYIQGILIKHASIYVCPLYFAADHNNSMHSNDS